MMHKNFFKCTSSITVLCICGIYLSIAPCAFTHHMSFVESIYFLISGTFLMLTQSQYYYDPTLQHSYNITPTNQSRYVLWMGWTFAAWAWSACVMCRKFRKLFMLAKLEIKGSCLTRVKHKCMGEKSVQNMQLICSK